MMLAITENKTDYEMLKSAFSEGYFILRRIKNKILLNTNQKEKLEELIYERDHFDILWFVKGLRN